MVATKEAQEQEVGVQMSVVCQKTFFLALRIIAFRSTLSKAKHPSLWRLFRHHQTAVNLLAIYICRYLYYIYICVCVCLIVFVPFQCNLQDVSHLECALCLWS